MIKLSLIMLATATIVSGCSISIGGTTTEKSNNNITYDCSVITEDASEYLNDKFYQCTDEESAKDREVCREQAIVSSCKPIFNSDKK